MSFVVYAISGRNDRVYVGQSEDFDRRLEAHNKGFVPSTRADRPWSLIKKQEFDTRDDARFFERQLKRSRGKRLKWIKTK